MKERKIGFWVGMVVFGVLGILTMLERWGVI